ncbi:MAG: hypothetical protein A3B91_03170 [Candidatus Yanofskybacteria bacterium RIFCSPHIGHO2_02_FULL_41_29]|nr:MAG: hypothetical protein A3B91_03170 [Candidatus Yanofskybacteria bacterium RIFCSPHIGHO2_02_FULL_41_29]
MYGLHSHTWDSIEIEDAKKLIGPILILGASGFIGAKLFFNLSQCRNDIFGCSRDIKNSWRFKYHNWQNLESLDITNYKEVERLSKRIRPKTIFNLSSYGGHSHQTDIEQIHQVNYIGATNILRAIADIEYGAFIQAGSSSEYGLNSAGPKEDAKLVPNSAYAESKVKSYYMVNYYGQAMFPVMHLRLYSIYGPWQERKTLMPVLISHCLENKWPPLVDKEASHDFVYVDDCAYAFVKAALALYEKKGFGKAVNIATGVKTKTEDLVKISQRIFGVTSEPIFGSMLNEGRDLVNWYGNPELALKELSWYPRVGLNQGIELTSRWEQEFKKTA